MKLTTAIRRFETQLLADGKSPHTREVYLRDLNSLARWLRKDFKISSITPHTLARYLSSGSFTHMAAGKGKAVISLNRSKSALRSFFRFLTDSGFLKSNPARLVRSARTSQKPPRILTEKECHALLETIKRYDTLTARRDFVIFSLLLGTGMRLGSLVNLEVDDVDLGQGTLRVNGKGNLEQVLFLSPPLRRLLRNYLKHMATKALFPIGDRQVQLRFALWLEKAGINRRHSVHALRHTFATRLYERTGDLRLVQVALGHRRVSTTEIYTRINHGRVRQAVRELGKQLSPRLV